METTKRGRGRPAIQPHGTHAAYRRHRYAGEEPCQECREAVSERNRRHYQQRKARQAAAMVSLYREHTGMCVTARYGTGQTYAHTVGTADDAGDLAALLGAMPGVTSVDVTYGTSTSPTDYGPWHDDHA